LSLGTVKMRARVTDLAGNEGTSSTSTVTIQSTTSWDISGGVSVTSPFGGDPTNFAGALQLSHPLDLDQSSGTSASGGAALIYESERVNVKPIVQATIQSDSTTALPSTITAQLTWNGSVVATQSFTTTGKSPGDLLTVALQVPTAQTIVGRYRPGQKHRPAETLWFSEAPAEVTRRRCRQVARFRREPTGRLTPTPLFAEPQNGVLLGERIPFCEGSFPWMKSPSTRFGPFSQRSSPHERRCRVSSST
jgi:hypothetical protein